MGLKELVDVTGLQLGYYLLDLDIWSNSLSIDMFEMIQSQSM